MKILSVDSSNDDFFSLAIILDSQVNFYKEYKEKITEKLFVVLDSLKNEIKEIDYFTFNIGPGSYTGIRAVMAALLGIVIGMKKTLLSANTFDVIAHKFLQESNNCNIGNKNIDIYLKSYNKDFVYNQMFDKNLNTLTKPKRVYLEDIRKDDQNIIISNILDFGIRIQTSAEDLGLFIKYKLENNLKFNDIQPLYINL